jgi:hypothetical protein
MSKNAAKTCRAQELWYNNFVEYKRCCYEQGTRYNDPKCDQMSKVRKEIQRRDTEWYHQIMKQREEKKKSDNNKDNCVITDEVPEGMTMYYSPYRLKDMRALFVNKK